MGKKGSPSFPIPDNVVAFIDRAADMSGRLKANAFNEWSWQRCLGLSSPIEQLFDVALNLVAECNDAYISMRRKLERDDGDDLIYVPQLQIDRYCVDFALVRHPVDKIVCVELDGHEFHDKDEHQRRYEKKRDRFLTAHGYHVLHFTGSEVVRDPCACALEAFNLVAGDLSAKYSVHPFKGE